jgi:hypothetical protein
MALVAIPGYGKQQRLIDFQNKSDEIKAGLEEVHLKAANAETGVTRYYAEIDDTSNEMRFGSWVDAGPGSPVKVYKTVKLTSDQTLIRLTDFDPISGLPLVYLVCDRSMNYCCYTDDAKADCSSPGTTNLPFVEIKDTDSSKTTDFKVYSNNFRITTIP